MIFVVIPNLNGEAYLEDCLNSVLLNNGLGPENVIVVENHSADGSLGILRKKFPKVTVLEQEKNLGFAGGVNAGIRYAMEREAEFVLLLNNDAAAGGHWAGRLVKHLQNNPEVGIAASKIIGTTDPPTLDSTGEVYSTWGLPYPRGRGGLDLDAYDEQRVIFGASGGASAYRVKTLKDIGLFDEDFFAYYEDVDISFRAQRAGWRVSFVPGAVVHHQIGQTSSRMKGFTTYQTFKNLPWLIAKNLPLRLWLTVLPRFTLAYWLLFASAVVKGRGYYALKGWLVSVLFLPKKLWQHVRFRISRQRMGASYISGLLYQGLPPDYKTLYRLIHPIQSRKARVNE